MKKHLLASFAFLLAMSMPLSAQEFVEEAVQDEGLADANLTVNAEKEAPHYSFFNHVGIGVSVGLMDGVSVSAGVPLGKNFQLRGGFSFPSVVKVNAPVGDILSDIEPVDINGTQEDISGCNLEAALQNSVYGILDIYPSGKHAFHFSVGAFSALNGDLARVSGDLTNIHSLTPADYGTLRISVSDNSSSEELKVTTDFDGKLQAGVEYKNKIMPYVGLGWGRAANLKHRVSVSFDLGVIATGGLRAYANDYYDSTDRDNQVVNKQYVTSGVLGDNDKDGWVDKIADGKGVFGFLPVIKLGLNVRLF